MATNDGVHTKCLHLTAKIKTANTDVKCEHGFRPYASKLKLMVRPIRDTLDVARQVLVQV